MTNITISLIKLGHWNSETNITTETWETVYSFDRKLFLYLPYGSALLVALILVVIGVISLVGNGVPAMAGSFLQAVCTTGGSPTLDKACAESCLGGRERASGGSKLENMVVQFGELMYTGRGGMQVAGFSDPHDVRRLDFNTEYGVKIENEVQSMETDSD